MSGKNLRDSVLDALRSSKGNPLSKSQLSRGLKLPGTRVTELRNTLDALVKEGLIRVRAVGERNAWCLGRDDCRDGAPELVDILARPDCRRTESAQGNRRRPKGNGRETDCTNRRPNSSNRNGNLTGFHREVSNATGGGSQGASRRSP